MPTKIASQKVWETKFSAKNIKEKSGTSKKIVVKKRKSSLTPTKASAAAITSQANRARKQALIDSVASKDINPSTNKKIPLWVWGFFWISLFAFCISFYEAIIRPQLNDEIVVDKYTYSEEVWAVQVGWNDSEINQIESDLWNDVNFTTNYDSNTAEGLTNLFFDKMSNQEFDVMYNFLEAPLQRSSEMKEHFTAFRLKPFIDWIVWNRLMPENIHYIYTNENWRDIYWFDLSYVVASTNVKYDEKWEVMVKNVDGELKIASITCITNKCSRHPIFWPESFGLMD